MKIRSKKNLRVVSAFVLTTFVGSLSAPAFAAGAAASPAGSDLAAKATVASTRALSDMWFVWNKHLANFQGPKGSLTPGYANQFFMQQGASATQAEVLANNARTQGQLNVKSPTMASTVKSWGDKLKGLFKKVGTPKANVAVAEAEAAAAAKAAKPGAKPVEVLPEAAAAKSAGLKGKVTSFFSRFKGSSSAAGSSVAGAKGTGNTYPTPNSLFGSKGSSTPAVSSKAVASVDVPKVNAVPKGAGDGGVLSSAVAKVKTAVSGVVTKTTNVVKGAADKVALTSRRGAHAVGTTAQTGYLTAKYAIDPRPYFEIPIKGDTVLKVRGTHKSTVAFKEGKFTVKDFNYKSTWPTKADLATKVDAVAAQSQPKGLFGKAVAKLKGMASNVKTRMRGEAKITPETKVEIQRLEISNNLIDQARTLSDAQRALRVRIDQMKHTSQSLRRPLDVEKVTAMEKQVKAIENTKKDLLKQASGTMDSTASKVVGDAAKWALYSVGITASVNIIRQAFSGDGIDLGAAFSFMATPSFWGGTAGGFLGSTLLSTVAASFMPPGVGIFMKVLPGFLGAALGFEFGGSLFGGEMDLLGTMVTTLASAGGYGLAFSLLGGAAAPGIALIGAAIAAGSLAGFLLDKFRGGPESESYVLPEAPVDQGGLDLAAPPSASIEPAPTDVKASITTANLSAAQKQVDQAYNAYIVYLKERKIPEATTAHKGYMDAMKQLELAKANAGR